MIEEKPYHESVMVMEDAEIYIISREDFFLLLHNNRLVANKFIKILSDNLAEREERLLKLAYNSVRKRVADSREDLANIVGAPKETVIRTLADYKDEKLIDSQGSKISILNGDKLRRMRN